MGLWAIYHTSCSISPSNTPPGQVSSWKVYLLLGLKHSQQLLESLELAVRIDVHIPGDTVRNVPEQKMMKHK